jgi:hypothetical protein
MGRAMLTALAVEAERGVRKGAAIGGRSTQRAAG